MKNCWKIDPHSRIQSQEIMRDMNQILYGVFNSRRTHSYSTVYPKGFRDVNGSKQSIFSTATDDTFLIRDVFSAHDMERDNKSLTSDISGSNGFSIWDKDDHFDSSTISCNLTSSPSLDLMDAMQIIFELSSDCNLVLQGRIGQGFYGEVYRGNLEKDKDTEPQLVAVKKLKTNALNSCLQDFEREISIMKTLKHPNIVEILCVFDEPEISLVMEYVANGSLQSYLKIHRDKIKQPQLLKYALDIAEGMEYLGKKHIVHRDLAARNILVANENLVKISDFGLAQVTGGKEDYYILKTNRDLPIKWYAPESLCDGKFSSRSDVWSYGITMFEMFSYGEDPVLPSMSTVAALSSSGFNNSNSQLLGEVDSVNTEPPQHTMFKILKSGERLKCPKRCSNEIYLELMHSCWKFSPSERRTFSELTVVSSELLRRSKNELGDFLG
ncbi:tyrosine-protein kinase hopscotch-like [Ctenocephalides felis]|uniref:tyrosine-protein kinase hopscotch-like n=1 Tax=Ctenocephalides felis TaxID=7515 RepID=UPI000E6E19CB|nr:tyrosine-protein kinase hopscotch-like [Ctenocephalides felis]